MHFRQAVTDGFRSFTKEKNGHASEDPPDMLHDMLFFSRHQNAIQAFRQGGFSTVDEFCKLVSLTKRQRATTSGGRNAADDPVCSRAVKSRAFVPRLRLLLFRTRFIQRRPCLVARLIRKSRLPRQFLPVVGCRQQSRRRRSIETSNGRMRIGVKAQCMVRSKKMAENSRASFHQLPRSDGRP